MALIVITVQDDADGVQVGVLSEPRFDTAIENTPAQTTATVMLDALKDEIKPSNGGRIQLLDH